MENVSFKVEYVDGIYWLIYKNHNNQTKLIRVGDLATIDVQDFVNKHFEANKAEKECVSCGIPTDSDFCEFCINEE